MTVPKEHRERLESLEESFGVEDSTIMAVILPEVAAFEDPGPERRDEHVWEWPEDVSRGDIVVEEEAASDVLEKVVIPHHRPAEYRTPVLVISEPEIAWIWREMPDDVRKRELEYRRENDQAVPPILEEFDD